MAAPLKARLRELVRTEGPIGFARFMATALYDPEHGYYAGLVERAGIEWVTAPTLTPAFGRALARGLLPMLRGVGGDPMLVEMGAGGGHLLADVVLALNDVDPGLVSRLQVTAVESAPAWLPRLEERFSAAGIEDVDVRTDLPSRVRGVVLSNELWDALPVHVAEWDAARWWERMVGYDDADDRMAWVGTAPAKPEVADALALSGLVPPDGTVVEAPVAAVAHVRELAARLEAGAIVSLDYGGTAVDLWRAHPLGTFHAYADGLRNDDVLADPGRQDITALVDWTILARAGERAGLQTAAYCPQADLLEGFGIASLAADGLEALAIKKLVDRAGAGGTFQALVQTKGLALPSEWPGAGSAP